MAKLVSLNSSIDYKIAQQVSAHNGVTAVCGFRRWAGDDVTQKLTVTSLMQKYYWRWLSTPTLLENPRDSDKFYQFVRACIHYGRKRRSGSWLRLFLEKDLAGRSALEHSDRLVLVAVSIFDHIAEYESVTFPDPMVEMKSPVSVKVAMRSVIRADGKRFYSDEDIQRHIQEHFTMKETL